MSQSHGLQGQKVRLYVMKISHFCERARWGLDHTAIPYEERAWAPSLHVPPVRRLDKETALEAKTQRARNLNTDHQGADQYTYFTE